MGATPSLAPAGGGIFAKPSSTSSTWSSEARTPAENAADAIASLRDPASPLASSLQGTPAMTPEERAAYPDNTQAINGAYGGGLVLPGEINAVRELVWNNGEGAEALNELDGVILDLVASQWKSADRGVDGGITIVDIQTRPLFSADNLYEDGGPSSRDIEQGGIGDCYFLAAIGALADQDPSMIHRAISYDDATASFNVRFAQPDGSYQTINVTQQDLADNVDRMGGSTLDSEFPLRACWPAVLEAAFAKAHDTNASDGLDEGYAVIGRGGFPDGAFHLFADTGIEQRHATQVSASQLDQWRADGDSITLFTQPGSNIEGMPDRHGFIVTDVEADESGETWVTLRNPWNGEDRSATAHTARYIPPPDLNSITVDFKGDNEAIFNPGNPYPAEVRVKLSELQANNTFFTVLHENRPRDVGLVIAQ